VDHLTYFLLAVAIFFTVLIFMSIFYFAIRYRRRSDRELPQVQHGGMALEVLWSVIPFGITMVMFGWGASVYFKGSRPPDDAMPLYAVGKQWMWKIEHMEGQREINELHVPLGRAVKLTMTSEDVIHSFYVPQLRLRQDIIPGREIPAWFEATRPGKYEIGCSQLCGISHFAMKGILRVLTPEEYQQWVSQHWPKSGAGTGKSASSARSSARGTEG
jgi:cytochrome c oxidase subunit 2